MTIKAMYLLTPALFFAASSVSARGWDTASRDQMLARCVINFTTGPDDPQAEQENTVNGCICATNRVTKELDIAKLTAAIAAGDDKADPPPILRQYYAILDECVKHKAPAKQ